MRVKDWLLDLSENHYVDLVEDEICILPIREDEDDN